VLDYIIIVKVQDVIDEVALKETKKKEDFIYFKIKN
jgi:hypothetical protein